MRIRSLRLGLILVLVALAAPCVARGAPAPDAAQPPRAQPSPCQALAGPDAAPARYLSLASPFSAALVGRIDHTVLYGATNRYGLLHTGFDMPARLSTPVYAAASGQVLLAGPDAALRYSPRANYYGKMIVLQADGPARADPVHVVYGHLDRVVVKTGQQVKAGDHIGYVGMTGIAVGPHLHLEVRYPTARFADARNPALWLSPTAGAGVIAGALLDAQGRPLPADRILVYRLAARQVLWRTIRTYQPGPGVQPDAAWQENFSVPDAPAGKYRIVAGRGAAARQVDVIVPAGGLAFVRMQLGGAPAGQTCTWSPPTTR